MTLRVQSRPGCSREVMVACCRALREQEEARAPYLQRLLQQKGRRKARCPHLRTAERLPEAPARRLRHQLRQSQRLWWKTAG